MPQSNHLASVALGARISIRTLLLLPFTLTLTAAWNVLNIQYLVLHKAVLKDLQRTFCISLGRSTQLLNSPLNGSTSKL